jgi:hypothetical protein
MLSVTMGRLGNHLSSPERPENALRMRAPFVLLGEAAG